MPKTIPVRLPEGFYEAVSELAEATNMDKSAVTALLVMIGLDDVRPDFWSERVKALVMADSMESSASFLRQLANMSEEDQARLASQLGDFLTTITSLFRVFRGSGLEGDSG